ncbi:MAG: hypothetical protein ACYCRF_13700 [Acidithiobacillus sp.]
MTEVRFDGHTYAYSTDYGGMVQVDGWPEEPGQDHGEAPPLVQKGFRGYRPPENRFIERKQRLKK